MSRISFIRNKVKFRSLLGVRARLVIFTLIIVGPLMVERIRALQNSRDQQFATAIDQFAGITQHSVDARREVMSSVEAVLASTGYVYRATGDVAATCAIMQKSLNAGPDADMPLIRSLAIADPSGKVHCATDPRAHQKSVGKLAFFQQALTRRGMSVSDLHISADRPTISAAYAMPGGAAADAVVIATINIDWMSDNLHNLGNQPGVIAVLIDAAGTVLAAPSGEAALIGAAMPNPGLLHAVGAAVAKSGKPSGALSFKTMAGTTLAVSYAGYPDTTARLIVSIDEAVVAAAADSNIRAAYLQLTLVCLFVLLGALTVADRLIIQPIRRLETMAKQFGRGDWSARVNRASLPTEFNPLARALYGMAAQLRGREIELRANNEQLTLIASMDSLSGLANRRGFQTRLEDEWPRTLLSRSPLSLLMIDVDHFKLYNDTYGHPQGDACLARIGSAIRGVAARSLGFGARYGGEEFCLLLPGTDSQGARKVAEMVRAAVGDLAIHHAGSNLRRVTVSIGVATRDIACCSTPEKLVEAADGALYTSKRSGRDAVVLHQIAEADMPSMMAL